MRESDIDRFIEQNITNFRLNGTGWKRLISDMLFEFCIAGWNSKDNVYGKEKYGSLQCDVVTQNDALKQQISTIVKKYQRIAGKTCEFCGNCGQHRGSNGWEFVACKLCYVLKGNFSEDPILFNPAECEICGYFAVENDTCKLCFNDVNDSKNKYLQHFESERKYLIHSQIEFFLDLDNDIELAKKLRRFKKSVNHEIVFTIEDLKKHIPEVDI